MAVLATNYAPENFEEVRQHFDFFVNFFGVDPIIALVMSKYEEAETSIFPNYQGYKRTFVVSDSTKRILDKVSEVTGVSLSKIIAIIVHTIGELRNELCKDIGTVQETTQETSNTQNQRVATEISKTVLIARVRQLDDGTKAVVIDADSITKDADIIVFRRRR